MPRASQMPQPTAASAAGLVAVDGRTYPLESVQVRARADGGVAATSLTQIYRNPYDEPLEVIYTLPLPADGAVTGYSFQLGDRRYQGVVRRREEAAGDYRQALLEGRAAALLEQDRADTFRQKLGSLPVGADVRVEIEVLQPLAFLPGTGGETPCWEYRWPTVAGVRYQGARGRVPDAPRLDVDRGDGPVPVELDGRLRIGDGDPDDLRPRSTGHAIRSRLVEEGTEVVLEGEARLDRDIVVRWEAAGDGVGLRLAEGPARDGRGGRFGLLTLTPPGRPERAFPRDLTILLDASGSMSGEPIRAAKALAAALVRGLDPGDRFELLAFSTEVRRLTPGMVEADEAGTGRALAALERLEAGGGTEMADAVTEALRPLRAGSQRQVVLLTDGYIGFEREVVGSVLRDLPGGARLHAVGIGAAPGRTLTRGAARAGRGVELLAAGEREAVEVSRRLRQATSRPVLVDLEVGGDGLRGVVPARPRDVLAGQPLRLAVELERGGGSVQMRGRLAGSDEPWLGWIEVPPRETDPPWPEPAGGHGPRWTTVPLDVLYGHEAIEDLESEWIVASTAEERADIDGRIEELGLRHRIPSRRTSLIAMADERTVDPGQPRRSQRLPVELPAGVSAEGVGLVRGTGGAPFLDRLDDPLAMHDEVVSRCRVESGVIGMERAEPGEAFSAPLAGRGSGPGRGRVQREEEAARRLAGIDPGGTARITGLRVLHLRDELLVLDFDVPFEGFVLPGDEEEIEVRLGGSRRIEAQVLGSASGPRGPHARGLVVRLALALPSGRCWHGPEVLLAWRAGWVFRGTPLSPVRVEGRIPPGAGID